MAALGQAGHFGDPLIDIVRHLALLLRRRGDLCIHRTDAVHRADYGVDFRC